MDSNTDEILLHLMVTDGPGCSGRIENTWFLMICIFQDLFNIVMSKISINGLRVTNLSEALPNNLWTRYVLKEAQDHYHV
ncbi:hypothetical protein BON22_3390 [Cyberlindnera fabianii]|uniref:Uncharacterized protein n=1 Tax=Cyberlindnera fabianii TaxID=36022 RepID=A0A1V2L4J6_CYBFA|nr:hypothetical protein BON22_3390 [Cyberlindnera fabianii]